MKFGLDTRKKMTGANLSVYIFQITSLLPALYIVAASGYGALFTQRGPAGFLCSLGFCGIPRAQALGLSILYRAFSSEAAVCFALLIISLIVGFAGNRLLRAKEKTAFTVRVVYTALIGADLIFRLLPLSFNGAFGFAPSACAFALRLLCLALVTADIVVYKKNSDIYT
ncbi:MAG: hypothetical protein IJS90_05325 [Clostridia bacterium]|nr:hypothetical protein [Clostridia bacterium]